MAKDLTEGNITKGMLAFALPMILGNLLQQVYNIADTLIVGRFLGRDALAAVGSSYTLMTFLTSIVIGLCMGSGTVFSICRGSGDQKKLKGGMAASLIITGTTAAVITVLAFILLKTINRLLRVPAEVEGMLEGYLRVVFCGILFVFLYNYFAFLLRAMGDSVTPLIFLAVCALLNVVLDFVFVLVLKLGVEGAAGATVLSQVISGIGLMIYTWRKYPDLRFSGKDFSQAEAMFGEIARHSFLTCVQQSIMNFGILMVQGLVNSFGTSVMAAFAAAVKIDSFAYMPVQDFGNAFSIFIAQNYGAGRTDRIRKGIRSAVRTAAVFCALVSAAVWIFAEKLMLIFVRPEETEILREGVRYLRIEGACYIGIGILFLLYGLYRAVEKPGMSVVLTVISLGTRVALAYALAAVPAIGVAGIWWSVPIGWALADLAGGIYYGWNHKIILKPSESYAKV